MRLVSLVAVVVLASVGLLRAGEAEEGFVNLFDGKTLNGWQGSVKGYVPENGVLVCLKKGGGQLFTNKEYGNFVFRFEFKLEPNANNGVGIRSPLHCDPAYGGMEIQILDDSGKRLHQAPAVPVSRLDLRRGAREEGLPETGRPVELGRDHVPGPSRENHTQRRGDRRRRSGQGATAGPQGASRPETRQGLHRLFGPRRADRVPQHPHQGTVNHPRLTATFPRGGSAAVAPFVACGGETDFQPNKDLHDATPAFNAPPPQPQHRGFRPSALRLGQQAPIPRSRSRSWSPTSRRWFCPGTLAPWLGPGGSRPRCFLRRSSRRLWGQWPTPTPANATGWPSPP